MRYILLTFALALGAVAWDIRQDLAAPAAVPTATAARPKPGTLVSLADAGFRAEAPRLYPPAIQPRETPAPVVEPGPDLAAYTDAELRALATSSAEAAVLLARHTPDPADAEQLYERAVVLSGAPGPLVEWMHWRDVGGIEHDSGVLNIDKARLGYEVALVQARFPYARQAVADAVAYYEQLLTAEGVALAPVRAQAARRYARLSEDRLAIVGWPWGQS